MLLPFSISFSLRLYYYKSNNKSPFQFRFSTSKQIIYIFLAIFSIADIVIIPNNISHFILFNLQKVVFNPFLTQQCYLS